MEVSKKPDQVFNYGREFNRLMLPFSFLEPETGSHGSMQAPDLESIRDPAKWKGFFQKAKLANVSDGEKGYTFQLEGVTNPKNGDLFNYRVKFDPKNSDFPVSIQETGSNGLPVESVTVEDVGVLHDSQGLLNYPFAKRLTLKYYDENGKLEETIDVHCNDAKIVDNAEAPFSIDYSLAQTVLDYDNRVFFRVKAAKSSPSP